METPNFHTLAQNVWEDAFFLTYWLAVKLLHSIQFYFTYIFTADSMHLILYDLQLPYNVQTFQIAPSVSSALQVLPEVNGNPEFHDADCKGK